jgi:hypothetical protein
MARCQAEMEGSREKERKWLRVSSAWDRRRSQRSGGERNVGRSKGGDKMVLIRPDGALGGVGAVVGGWDVLKLDRGERLAKKSREVLTRLII